jgi:hypothetical protein
LVKVINNFEEEISEAFANIDHILVDYGSNALLSSEGIKSYMAEDVVGKYVAESKCLEGEVHCSTHGIIDLSED